MKYPLKSSLLITVFMSTFLLSCSTDAEIATESLNDFGSSVAIVNKQGISKSDLTNTTITIHLVNFNPNYSLESKYKINNIEYSDNGLYNDEVAGDGLYTSVEKFDLSKSNFSTLNNSDAHLGSSFAYINNFKIWVGNNSKSFEKSGIKPTVSIKVNVGCDIVTRSCPQDTWYNTCLFSDECTCVYLENCKLDVTIEVGIK
jgi:hypothetical protein